MNRFIIINGLPYLYANGKAYSCRFDEKGFTLGAEVELTSVPNRTFSELSIKAKCAGHLDSIGEQVDSDEEQPETPVQESVPEAEDVEQKTPGADEEQPETPVQDFESMKLEALKKYASDKGIALNGARTKPAIIDAIKAASAE